MFLKVYNKAVWKLHGILNWRSYDLLDSVLFSSCNSMCTEMAGKSDKHNIVKARCDNSSMDGWEFDIQMPNWCKTEDMQKFSFPNCFLDIWHFTETVLDQMFQLSCSECHQEGCWEAYIKCKEKNCITTFSACNEPIGFYLQWLLWMIGMKVWL